MSEILEAPIAEPQVCGHINKHFHGISGRLEDLLCDLLVGHIEDHHAIAPALRQVEDNFETALKVKEGAEKFVIAGKTYITTHEDAYWSDAAGIPASEIKPDLEQLAALKKARNAA